MSVSRPYPELPIHWDREDFLTRTAPEFLRMLEPGQSPVWGEMSPGHMVEHLIYITENCRGVREIPLLIPEEELPKYKGFLMSRYGFTRNFKFPLLPESGLLPLTYRHYGEALDALTDELENFFDYIDDPDFEYAPHPFYGPMSREEAIMFQFKHFLHHMMQFGFDPDTEKNESHVF